MTDAAGNDVTWRVGQRIHITCQRSKHYGRYATVTDISRSRLGLSFEDGRSGKFIDQSRAFIVAEPPATALAVTATGPAGAGNPHVTPRVIPTVVRNDGDHHMVSIGSTPTASPMRLSGLGNDVDRDVTELTRLLDHMAFTIATLISSNAEDPALVSRTLADFQEAVQDNTMLISRQ